MTKLAIVLLIGLAWSLVAAYAVRRLSKMAFPPATTFAEGQRALSLWLMAGGTVFQSAIEVCAVAILVWGGWPPEQDSKIISLLGWMLIASALMQGLGIIGLMVGGPVGRFKGKASKDGVEWDADRDDDPIPPNQAGGGQAQ